MVTLDAIDGLHFQVDAPNANAVTLVGIFDGWHEEHIPMQRCGGPAVGGRANATCWHVRINPGFGELLFRYRVDEPGATRWMLEPDDHGRCVGADGVERSRIYRPPLSLDPDVLAA